MEMKNGIMKWIVCDFLRSINHDQADLPRRKWMLDNVAGERKAVRLSYCNACRNLTIYFPNIAKANPDSNQDQPEIKKVT